MTSSRQTTVTDGFSRYTRAPAHTTITGSPHHYYTVTDGFSRYTRAPAVRSPMHDGEVSRRPRTGAGPDPAPVWCRCAGVRRIKKKEVHWQTFCYQHSSRIFFLAPTRPEIPCRKCCVGLPGLPAHVFRCCDLCCNNEHSSAHEFGQKKVKSGVLDSNQRITSPTEFNIDFHEISQFGRNHWSSHN